MPSQMVLSEWVRAAHTDGLMACEGGAMLPMSIGTPGLELLMSIPPMSMFIDPMLMPPMLICNEAGSSKWGDQQFEHCILLARYAWLAVKCPVP